MNICFLSRVIFTHEIGGMQHHAQMLSEGMSRLGHTVTVITASNRTGVTEEFVNGVTIHYLKGVGYKRYSRAFWKQSYKKIIALNELNRFDVIFAESTSAYGLIKYKFKKKYKIPIISFVHGSSLGEVRSTLKQSFKFSTIPMILYYLYGYITYSLLSLLYSDLIICISEQLINITKNEYPLVTKERIIFEPNGVDGNRFKPVSVIKSKNEHVLLSIGRLSEQKGFHIVISILPDLIKKLGPIKYYIAGVGDYQVKLQDLANRLNVTDSVIFLGAVKNEDLNYYYNLADVYVLPSIGNEGFPFVIFEAMACAKPIITANLGSIPFVIKQDENGILVRPGDSRGFKRSIFRVIENPDLSRKLGSKAREAFLNKFEFNKILQNIVNIGERLSNRFRDP